MGLEIERKFLIRNDSSFLNDAFEATHICQGYIACASGRTVRVRIRGDKGYLTIKGRSGDSGLTRFEWEKEIPLDEAQSLMELAVSGIIDKTRYLIRNSDGIHIWEVDVFNGDNDGLIMAEIELNSEDEDFDRPSWLGPEVTGDRKYYNSALSSNPYKNWEK